MTYPAQLELLKRLLVKLEHHNGGIFTEAELNTLKEIIREMIDLG